MAKKLIFLVIQVNRNLNFHRFQLVMQSEISNYRVQNYSVVLIFALLQKLRPTLPNQMLFSLHHMLP
jgi:hypothetical protein